MNFTWEGQEAAARARCRLQAAFRRAALRGTSGEDAAAALRAEFRDAISDDLNMPRALSVVHKAVRPGIGGDVGPVARGGVGHGPRRGLLSEADGDAKRSAPRRRAGGDPGAGRGDGAGAGGPAAGARLCRGGSRSGRGSAPSGYDVVDAADGAAVSPETAGPTRRGDARWDRFGTWMT